MNTPNKLTLLRVILVPVFMVLLLIDSFGAQLGALAVFAAASLTDMLDGKIARKYNLITTFGKFMDPLADKMLTTAAFVIFLQKGIMDSWALMIILAREFMVSGVRLVAAGEGKIIAAAFWGKFKTVAQMAAIMATIVLTMGFIPLETGMAISRLLIWISVIFTVISGIEYVWKNRHLIKMK
ncbi:MAG: CDP-diacylglycerol--glycerol-3-phosphate 3-phosphatidyltransferase [Clostridiales bacterium]|nr:CDP-diacylglycerol--glycerol-3-phosphate 3-phosphatidyltransferase [Clostridiales bacterium]